MEDINNLRFGEILQTVLNEVRQIVAQEVSSALIVAKNEPEKMYSRDEACKLLHISMPTLWKWERDGKIQGQRAGRRVLFSTQEIRRVLGKEGGIK